MNVKKILDFKKICRICLCEKKDLKPLFTACLAQMLINCTSVKVEEQDGLPAQICTSCFQQVSRYYSFKCKVEKADKFLKNYLKELKKSRSIIAQAATNADIDMSSDSYLEIKEQTDSEDDVQLSVRKLKGKKTKNDRPKRQAKLNSIKKTECLIKVEEENTNSPLELKNLRSNEIHFIFSNEPPPLVPLIPIPPEKIPAFPTDKKLENVTTALQPISDETPPLIPIKPIENSVKIESNTNQALKIYCMICKDEFSASEELRKHIRLQHFHSANLTCSICKKEFLDAKRLINHLKRHVVEKHYACKICNKRYPNPSTFKVHLRTHTGEKPFKCSICGKGFVRYAGLHGHMKCHSANKPFKCNICQKSFKISSNLERHKVLHSGMMPYCCNFCGKTFNQSDNLQLHIRTYHTHERPYLCNICGKGFVSSPRLNRHMWTHAGYKPYSCKICTKAYSNSNDFKNHVKSHNGGPSEADKPHVCTVCNMRFFHHCRLTKHMKTHEKPYSCTECMKSFSREDIFQKHIQKHAKQDTFDNI